MIEAGAFDGEGLRHLPCVIAWTIDTHSQADHITGGPGLVNGGEHVRPGTGSAATRRALAVGR